MHFDGRHPAITGHTFRVGCIGTMDAGVIERAVAAIAASLGDMGITLTAKDPSGPSPPCAAFRDAIEQALILCPARSPDGGRP